MPSLEHDAAVDLFRRRPRLALELLRERLGVPVPAVRADGIAAAESDLTQLTPAEYRADLVLVADALVVVVEVQRARDDQKRDTWPEYIAGLRARQRRPVILLVVAPDAGVARWARRPIPLGHPGFVLTPLVLGPDELPVVADPERARARPELAVLSALAHGRSPRGEAIGRAALMGFASLDDERARLYLDLVLVSLHDEAYRILEALMQQPYEYQSPILRRTREEGREEGREAGREAGREEGALQALARSILVVFSARGLSLSDTERVKILSCRDAETLERWLGQAATATSVGGALSD